MARSSNINEAKKRFPKNQNFNITDFLMVCPYDIDELRTPDRTQDLREWRQIGMSWKAIQDGGLMGASRMFKRDHATVLHSLKLVVDALDGYHDDLAEKIYKVCEKVTPTNLRIDSEDMNEIASAMLIERNLIEKFSKLAQ